MMDFIVTMYVVASCVNGTCSGSPAVQIETEMWSPTFLRVEGTVDDNAENWNSLICYVHNSKDDVMDTSVITTPFINLPPISGKYDCLTLGLTRIRILQIGEGHATVKIKSIPLRQRATVR